MSFFRLASTMKLVGVRGIAHGCDHPSNLYLIRHGARHDHLEPKWKDESKSLGLNVRDPPLSALGHRQGRDTAKHLARLPSSVRPEKILVSPYLRVIQTAAPTADILGLKLEVEQGLAEIHHILGQIPEATERFAYFPQISVGNDETLSLCEPTADTTDPETGLGAESYPLGYLTRLKRFAPLLSKACDGRNVACFSHAASVALVAALLGETELSAVGAFAPTGIFHLRSAGGGAPWVLESHGGTNPHVSENHSATYPWAHPEESAQVWRQLHKGPRPTQF